MVTDGQEAAKRLTTKYAKDAKLGIVESLAAEMDEGIAAARQADVRGSRPFWNSGATMHSLLSWITKHRLFALAAVGSVLLVVSAAAARNPEITPTAHETDVVPAEKSAEKPTEKPKRIVQSRDDSVLLTARDATVHGAKLRYEPQKDTLGYWFNAGDWVSWDFEITHPAKLFVDLTQSCGSDSAGCHYTVSVGDQILKDKVQDTGSFRVFRLRRIGTLQFDKPGIYTLSVRSLDKPSLEVMDLRRDVNTAEGGKIVSGYP